MSTPPAQDVDVELLYDQRGEVYKKALAENHFETISVDRTAELMDHPEKVEEVVIPTGEGKSKRMCVEVFPTILRNFFKNRIKGGHLEAPCKVIEIFGRNRQKYPESQIGFPTLGESLGIWQTDLDENFKLGFIRNPLFFLEREGITSRTGTNERNTTPYIMVREEYIMFWNTLRAYLEDYDPSPAHPESDAPIVLPLSVVGLSNIGKSSLLWATVEILPKLFPRMQTSTVLIELYGLQQAPTPDDGSKTEILRNILILECPGSRLARIYYLSDLNEKDCKNLTKHLPYLDKETRSQYNVGLTLQIMDGLRIPKEAAPEMHKCLIFCSTSAGNTTFGSSYAFSDWTFVLSPWTKMEVALLWVFFCHRLNKDYMTDAFRKRFSSVKPAEVVRRFKMLGGAIGLLFPANELKCSADLSIDKPSDRTSLAILNDKIDRINNEVVLFDPDVVRSNPQTSLTDDKNKAPDSLFPQVNDPDSWYVESPLDFDVKNGIQKSYEDFNDAQARAAAIRNSYELLLKKPVENIDVIPGPTRNDNPSFIVIERHKLKDTGLIKTVGEGKAYKCQTSRQPVSAGAFALILARGYAKLVDKELRQNPKQVDGKEFERRVLNVMRGLTEDKEELKESVFPLMAYRSILYAGDPQMTEQERVFLFRKLSDENKKCKAGKSFAEMHDTVLTTGIPLNTLVTPRNQTEPSFDAFAMMQHEGPLHAFNGRDWITAVDLNTQQLMREDDEQRKQLLSGFETVWVQITKMTTEHVMRVTDWLKNVWSMEVKYWRCVAHNEDIMSDPKKKNHKMIMLPSKSPAFQQHHVLYVYPHMNGVPSEPAHHWVEKKEPQRTQVSRLEQKRTEEQTIKTGYPTALERKKYAEDQLKAIDEILKKAKENNRKVLWEELTEENIVLADCVFFWQSFIPIDYSTAARKIRSFPVVDITSALHSLCDKTRVDEFRKWFLNERVQDISYAEKIREIRAKQAPSNSKYVTDTREAAVNQVLREYCSKEQKSHRAEQCVEPLVKQYQKDTTARLDDEWRENEKSRQSQLPANTQVPFLNSELTQRTYMKLRASKMPTQEVKATFAQGELIHDTEFQNIFRELQGTPISVCKFSPEDQVERWAVPNTDEDLKDERFGYGVYPPQDKLRGEAKKPHYKVIAAAQTAKGFSKSVVSEDRMLAEEKAFVEKLVEKRNTPLPTKDLYGYATPDSGLFPDWVECPSDTGK